MRTRNPLTFCCLLSLFVGGTWVNAAPLEEARVSRVIQDVRLLAGNAAPRPASINDDVKQGMAVRTGAESRAELTFTDLTITRLGQNTVFSIKGGTREVALDSGAVLLQVPHGGEPANVRTAAVTASISGGTMMISANKNFPTKVLVPEGVSHFCSLIHPNECVDVHGGEMAMMLPDGSLTKPEKFNGKLVYQTAHLLTDFPPLPNEYLFVFNEVGEPDEEPPPNEGDEIDKTDQAVAASPSATESASATPTPSSPTPTPSTPTPTPGITPTPTPGITPTPTPGITPTPTPGITPTPTPGGTPGKFGPPTTIKSPNPYVIDSGTVITTDPSITTNGATDYGTIYRGPKEDGAFSTWAFGSTSSFDTSSGFDDQIDSSGAVFKFSSLVIAGNPTVITDQGETDLGLIGVDGITIDIVGDLTFAPIEGLLFATVNGPIFLGSKTSFSGMRELIFYARGATSDLTSNAQMTTLRHVRLYAERDIYLASQISTEKFKGVSGRDIALNSSDASAIDAVTIHIFAGRDLQLASGLFTSKTATDSEGEVSLLAENDISSTVGIYLLRQNGGISDGLNLTLNAKGNDITIGQGVGDKAFTGLTMIVDNDGSDLNSGGNITVNAGNNFTIQDGGALYLNVDNSDDAHIGDGGNINVSAGGEVSVPSFYAAIDNSDGGTMDLTAEINVTAANISAAGNLDADIFNHNGGGTIGDDARVHFDVPGDLSVMGNAGFLIDNTNGTIGADAKIDIANAPNISVEDNLNFRILNRSGTIGGNAIIDVVANSIVVGGNLNAYVDNTNGSIGGGGQSPAGGINGGSVSLESFGSITVTGRLNVFGTVLADDDVTVGTLSVTDLDTQGNDTIVGAGGITRFSFPNQAPPDVLHTLTTRLLTSAGGINFDGAAADGDFSMATDGGRLIINALILSFGPLGNIVGPVTFNGGNASSTFGPGSGGSFTVNTTSDITVSSDIEATSGVQDILDPPRGDGGTVELNASNGTVTVNNRIEVSSNDPEPAAPSQGFSPGRNSNSGGTINITSGKLTGAAIQINSSAQLLALLDNAATGPGGNITIVASRPGSNGSNSSSIDIDNGNGDPGAIIAERGTVEIRHDGASGVINISSANIFADVVKIGALGTSGTLSIGGGTISANTMLKLYAPGSNGLIEFTSNVLLDQDSTKILAANTVTILDGVTVTIGGKTAADVYVTFVGGVPNANYTGSGGNGTTTGSFGGAGANAPQPLASAPPFGGAGTSGSRHNIQVAVPVRQNGILSGSHIRSPGPTNLPPIRQ